MNNGFGIEVERVVGRAGSRGGHGGAVGDKKLGENGGGDVEDACLDGSGYKWRGHGEGGAWRQSYGLIKICWFRDENNRNGQASCRKVYRGIEVGVQFVKCRSRSFIYSELVHKSTAQGSN